MLDHKVSPLLDAMEVKECFAQHGGASCYRILHPESGREFVLKHISVPASEEQVEALLLTGAYANEAEADDYYRREAEDLVREAEARKRLLDCPYILPFLGVQMEKKEGVGYDVYAVLPKRNSLETYLAENSVSHLRGINMGIDLCVALSALREEGFVHANLKPGNVFFSDTGRFLLGDFGLISTDDMQYAILPEQYRSSYSAPELGGIIGGLNPTVDIYSLGMILYRIYNGNHAPFEDEKTGPKAAEVRRMEGEALPAPLYADYELAGIICKACAADPADRFQTPEEMRVELEQYMRRNAVSDHLIVPPLVADPTPLSAEAAAEQAEPVRFADPETMDENFKKTFAPEESKNKGKDKKRWRDEDPLPISDQPVLTDEPPQVGLGRRRMIQKLKKAKERRKRAWIALAVAAALLLGCFCLYEFTDLGKGLWHYMVSVEELQVLEVTADSIQLRLTTQANPEDFTAYCQDAYGNSLSARFVNSVAVFRGLTPSTQYNLKVEISGLHRLSGTTTAIASTKARTEILTFEAAQDNEADAVRLSITVKEEDTAPAFWTLAYGKAGEVAQATTFAGNTCRITGLEIGAAYTFTLLESENLYLAGQTELTFTPLVPVEASDLRLEALREGEATVSWHCASALPETWTLTCMDADGFYLPTELQDPVETENGWYCSARIPDLEAETAYTLQLSAPGMPATLSMTLRDDAIQVESFQAEATADGLVLHWTASRDPGGWRITAAFGEGLRLEREVEGDSCTMAVLPEQTYTLTLERADGGALAGETELTVRSANTQRFLQMGVTRGTTIGLYYRPNKETYTYNDLNLTGTVRFRATDRVCFAVVAGGRPVDSDEIVTLHYVFRNASTNREVAVTQEQKVWNDLWDGNRYVADIPESWLPEAPGSYTFTVYINSQRMATITFTLVG